LGAPMRPVVGRGAKAVRLFLCLAVSPFRLLWVVWLLLNVAAHADGIHIGCKAAAGYTSPDHASPPERGHSL
jgi:hypothetical protein